MLLFNKPHGVLCQFSKDKDTPVLSDYIPVPDVYPAGRLDKESEGLLLLTDDGKLQNRISNPVHKLSKTYWVQVEGEISESALNLLRSGIQLKDGLTRPAQAQRMDEPESLWERRPPIRVRKAIPTAWLELKLCEGKNRQVRRMTAAAGIPTLRLIRFAIGPYSLAGLSPGDYRWINWIN